MYWPLSGPLVKGAPSYTGDLIAALVLSRLFASHLIFLACRILPLKLKHLPHTWLVRMSNGELRWKIVQQFLEKFSCITVFPSNSIPKRTENMFKQKLVRENP